MSSNNVQGSVTLGPLGTDTEDWFYKSVNNGSESLAKGLAKSNEFMIALLKTAGLTSADIDKILLLAMKVGSLNVEFVLGAPDTVDPATFASSFQQKLTSGKFEGFALLKADTTYNGVTTTSESSGANLGLILGITVPLVVLRTLFVIQWESSSYSSRSTPAATLRTKIRTRPTKMCRTSICDYL
jgi:hypothetical protein